MIKGRPDPPLTSTSFVPAILAVVSVQFANGVSSLLGLICKCTSFDITCAAGSESVRHGEGEQPVSRASDAKRNTLVEKMNRKLAPTATLPLLLSALSPTRRVRTCAFSCFLKP